MGVSIQPVADDTHAAIYDDMRKAGPGPVVADALPARPRGKSGEYQRKPLPFRRVLGEIPEELEWQRGFLDTLTQLAGQPKELYADAYPAPAVGGLFEPRGQRITLRGMIMPEGENPEDTRYVAAHEYAHLLAHNDDRIIKAFMGAAPLPVRLQDNPHWKAAGMDFGAVWRGVPADTTTREPTFLREHLAHEAFADMFALDLAKRFPQMAQYSSYPFTKQFRGRGRERMVDSLVNTLLPNLNR